MKKLLAIAALVTAATPALADFWIVQEPTTKHCRIVEERPAPGAGVVIGDRFGVRVEAESHMKTVEVCREGTVGGPARPDVRIEERERIPPR